MPYAIKRDMGRRAYEVYVTDALKALIGANDRYLDWVERKPVDNRTGAEIAASVIKKAGLNIKEK